MDRLGTHSKGRDSAHTEHDLYLNYREIHINVIIHTYIYIQIKLTVTRAPRLLTSPFSSAIIYLLYIIEEKTII